MGALTIGLQLVQAIPMMINLYKTIQTDVSAGQLPPLETLLAQADADWATIAATAEAQVKG